LESTDAACCGVDGGAGERIVSGGGELKSMRATFCGVDGAAGEEHAVIHLLMTRPQELLSKHEPDSKPIGG
jgi:hypothetical protein